MANCKRAQRIKRNVNWMAEWKELSLGSNEVSIMSAELAKEGNAVAETDASCAMALPRNERTAIIHLKRDKTRQCELQRPNKNARHLATCVALHQSLKNSVQRSGAGWARRFLWGRMLVKQPGVHRG